MNDGISTVSSQQSPPAEAHPTTWRSEWPQWPSFLLNGLGGKRFTETLQDDSSSPRSSHHIGTSCYVDDELPPEPACDEWKRT